MSKEYNSGNIGHRHGLLLMLFLGCLFVVSSRTGLSVTIVAMTKHDSSTVSTEKNSSSDTCPRDLETAVPDSDRKTNATFDWDSKTQGIIHGAFFYGYTLTQLPGGLISDRFGAKLPIAISVFLIGALSVMAPAVAGIGMWPFFFIRLLSGVAQGALSPSITSLWSQWAPPSERGRLMSGTYCGSHLGTAFGMSMAGILSDYFGWQSVFYTFGALCLIWTIPWMLTVSNSPEIHPTISKAEREYILTSIDGSKAAKVCATRVKKVTPWRSIFTCVPFWALVVVDLGHNWGIYTMQINIATYMNNVQHFSLKSNGLLSAMPYLIRFGLSIFVAFLADWMIEHKTASTTVLRKTFTLIAFLGSTAALVGVGFAGCNGVLAVTLFTAAIAISAFVRVGYLINYSDLSVNYAGTIEGLVNTIGSITSVTAPYVNGILTNGDNAFSLSRWRIVFAIPAGLYVLVSLVYVVFGSAKRQKWDSQQAEDLTDAAEEQF